MNNNLIITILISIAAGYFIRKIPGIITIALIVAALYAVQLGSNGQLPMVNDLMNGIQMLINKQGMMKL